MVLLYRWFRRLIIEDRGTTLAIFLLSLLVLESVLFNDIDVPFGLFHVQAGPLQVRTLDLIFLVAIIARASVRDRRPFDLVMAAWVTFATWMTLEAYLGKTSGNSGSYILYEYKALIYLGLGYVVGQARVDRPEDVQAFAKFCKWVGVVGGVLLLTNAAHVTFTLGGILPGAQLGVISSITASIFPEIGIFALAIFLCSRPLRYDLLASAIVLFLTVLAPSQRASLVNLAACLVALFIFVPMGARHLKITLTQLGLGVGAVVFVAVGAWTARAVATGKGTLPFSNNVAEVLYGNEKRLSAQDRVNQFAVAKHLIRQHEIIGWGLGKTLVYYEAGLQQFVTIFLSHNILTDLLIRMGAIGLLAFIVAFTLSLNDAVKSWRSSLLSSNEAAFALAAIAILIGWFAHGMVESLFEHVRLTPFTFIFVGLARAASRRHVVGVTVPEERLEWAAAREATVRDDATTEARQPLREGRHGARLRPAGVRPRSVR
jgi:hypothetical protein